MCFEVSPGQIEGKVDRKRQIDLAQNQEGLRHTYGSSQEEDL